MTTQVLLTHHHRDAMENAADRGFWMPLAIPVSGEALHEVMYLTSISYGERTIRELLQITSFEPWREADGLERWLPFVGRRIRLPRPLPLGDRRLLAGWLPRRREAVQLVALNALLKVDRLSDALSGSGAHCPLTGAIPWQPPAVVDVPAGDRAA